MEALKNYHLVVAMVVGETDNLLELHVVPILWFLTPFV